MARIRVNTEDLRDKAKDFESAAEAFNRAGDEIAALAMTMPSYDGQLSGPARKAGYEIQSQARALGAALAGNAKSLRTAAQDFDDVNNRTIEALAQNQNSLSSYTLSEVRGIDIGTSYLGYRDDGISPTVILCMYGVCRVVQRAGNEALIAQFEEKVDAYEAARKTRDDGLIALGIAAGTATVGILGATTGIGVLVALIGLAGEAAAWKIVEDAKKLMADATYGAAYYWNTLFGEELTGDDNQGPLDQLEDYDDIYEPIIEIQ